MYHSQFRHSLVVFLFFILIFMGGCSLDRTPDDQNGRLQVATSFFVLENFARTIGGQEIEVFNLVPSGVEPHSFEPSAQDIARLYQADIFLYQGAGFDTWTEKFRTDFERTTGKPTESDIMRFLPVTDFFNLRSEGSIRDPHIWLDPVLAQQIVTVIEQSFTDRDSANTENFQANADGLRKELQQLHEDYENQLSFCRKKEIIVAHDAFSYLASRYGITLHAISGLSPEDEPSPARLSELTTLAKEKHIQYIFFESLTNPQVSETLAREVGAQTLVLNPIEGLTLEQRQQGKNYVDLMRQNLENLALAMECQ